jgi:C4-dicarboxylate transporter DctM subunit
MFAVFVGMMLAGAPIFVAVGSGAIAALAAARTVPLEVVPQRMFSMMDSFSLLAVPFFVLAGDLMEGAGISRRIVRFSAALVGHMRGGFSQVTIVACTIFAGLTGSGAADASATGSVLIPAMVRQGYAPGYVAALAASAGALGPIIPPSIVAIIYASIANVSVGKLFLAGVIPGLLIAGGFMMVAYLGATRPGRGALTLGQFSWAEIRASVVEASLALVAPLIILGGIVGGVFTATEAGAIAAVYALVVGTVVYRELTVARIWTAFLRSARVTSALMLVVALSGAVSWILASARFPVLVERWLTSLASPTVVMLVILAVLLVLGCFLELITIAIILVPVLHPVGQAMGYDEIHFAFVIVLALVIGTVTPPVGLVMYVTTSMAGATVGETSRYLAPFLIVFVAVLLLVAFVPALSTAIPNLLIP